MSDAEKASRELDKPNEACRQAEQMLQDARARHLHDIASELAAGLSAGASCPVCGSTDHPRKAKPSGRPVDLEAAERRRDQAVERRTVGQQKLKEAQSALEAARRAHAKLPTKEQQKDLRLVAGKSGLRILQLPAALVTGSSIAENGYLPLGQALDMGSLLGLRRLKQGSP